MTDKKDRPNVNTEGGTYVNGGVNTGGGDFVARDKHVHGAPGSVTIGGNASGNTIVVGNGNRVGNTEKKIFAPVYQAIQVAVMKTQDREDAKAEVQDIEAEVHKGEGLDKSSLARRLRSLRRIAPAIAPTVFAALADPDVPIAARQVAAQVRNEA